jgi:hypothetical protein
VNALLLAAGALVVAGGIACVTARRAWAVALGAVVLLGLAPLLAEPLPSTLLLVEAAIGAALAGELLWLGLRRQTLAGASALGWPPLALLAVAAFAAGVGAQRLVPGAGPSEALGTGLALFTVAIVAVAGRSDGVHLGLSALVVVAATGVIRLALSGPASSLETLLTAGVALAIAGAVALLVPRAEPLPPGALPGARPTARVLSGAALDATPPVPASADRRRASRPARPIRR